jgi:hypothetical protein
VEKIFEQQKTKHCYASDPSFPLQGVLTSDFSDITHVANTRSGNLAAYGEGFIVYYDKTGKAIAHEPESSATAWFDECCVPICSPTAMRSAGGIVARLSELLHPA